MARGLYDYKGEYIGYVANGSVYTVDGVHTGYLEKNRITDLSHNLVWNRDADGIYDQHWVSIGYIGSEVHHED